MEEWIRCMGVNGTREKVVGGGVEGGLKLFDLETLKEIDSLVCKKQTRAGGGVNSICF